MGRLLIFIKLRYLSEAMVWDNGRYVYDREVIDPGFGISPNRNPDLPAAGSWTGGGGVFSAGPGASSSFAVAAAFLKGFINFRRTP